MSNPHTTSQGKEGGGRGINAHREVVNAVQNCWCRTIDDVLQQLGDAVYDGGQAQEHYV